MNRWKHVAVEAGKNGVYGLIKDVRIYLGWQSHASPVASAVRLVYTTAPGLISGLVSGGVSGCWKCNLSESRGGDGAYLFPRNTSGYLNSLASVSPSLIK